MTRKRMLDPNLWTDPHLAKANDTEKLLFIGIFSHADDEGRLIATPEALKASIFPYDSGKTASVVKKARDSLCRKMKNIVLYQVDGVEYIWLQMWERYQKPTHFKDSILPPPLSGNIIKDVEKHTGQTSNNPSSTELSNPASNTLGQSTSSPSLGQSSQGNKRREKERKEEKGTVTQKYAGDFGYLDINDPDITEILTATLETAKSKSVLLASETIGAFCKQFIDRWDDVFLQQTLDAVRNYPPAVLAGGLVKAGKYQGGEQKSWKYIEKCIEEILDKAK